MATSNNRRLGENSLDPAHALGRVGLGSWEGEVGV